MKPEEKLFRRCWQSPIPREPRRVSDQPTLLYDPAPCSNIPNSSYCYLFNSLKYYYFKTNIINFIATVDLTHTATLLPSYNPTQAKSYVQVSKSCQALSKKILRNHFYIIEIWAGFVLSSYFPIQKVICCDY